MKAKVVAKPAAAAKPSVAASAPRIGTREYRDMQRAEFDRKMDAQKKAHK